MEVSRRSSREPTFALSRCRRFSTFALISRTCPAASRRWGYQYSKSCTEALRQSSRSGDSQKSTRRVWKRAAGHIGASQCAHLFRLLQCGARRMNERGDRGGVAAGERLLQLLQLLLQLLHLLSPRRCQSPTVAPQLCSRPDLKGTGRHRDEVSTSAVVAQRSALSAYLLHRRRALAVFALVRPESLLQLGDGIRLRTSVTARGCSRLRALL